MDHVWNKVRRLVANAFAVIGIRVGPPNIEGAAELDHLIEALFRSRSHPGGRNLR